MILQEYIEYQSTDLSTSQQHGTVNSDLPGFDPKYASFVEYILGITEDIWEKHAIWVLYDTYDKEIIVHTGAQTLQGLDSVIHGTLKTLYSFPDRNMYGEAVIWAHYQDTSTHRYTKSLPMPLIDTRTFFSSHRIYSHATNLGSTAFGDATGIQVHFRTIADCVAKENLIFEEWLVRDNLSILRQLGYNPVAMAKKDERYKGKDIAAYHDGCTEIALDATHYAPQVTMLCTLFKTVWIEKNFNALEDYYSPSATSYSICDSEAKNNTERTKLFETLLLPFSNTHVRLDQCTSTYAKVHCEVALRWRLIGRHSAASELFGEPTNATVNVLGINHYIIDTTTNKIIEEWMVYDAFDVLCQIHSQQ